ncbi:hypothetical protein VNO77_25976 [Canavalia gladiata]|uniref:Uncharacterized protein n=1 Tax=Canavalia gladiata TaxID=3824 RepID=A0AAN9KUI1_CANGL
MVIRNKVQQRKKHEVQNLIVSTDLAVLANPWKNEDLHSDKDDLQWNAWPWMEQHAAPRSSRRFQIYPRTCVHKDDKERLSGRKEDGGRTVERLP